MHDERHTTLRVPVWLNKIGSLSKPKADVLLRSLIDFPLASSLFPKQQQCTHVSDRSSIPTPPTSARFNRIMLTPCQGAFWVGSTGPVDALIAVHVLYQRSNAPRSCAGNRRSSLISPNIVIKLSVSNFDSSPKRLVLTTVNQVSF